MQHHQQSWKRFLQKSLHDNKNNFKAIFNICNNLLGRNLDLPLPPSDKNKMLAEVFNTFFIDKIAKIRDNLQHTRVECNLVQSTTYINKTCNLQSHQPMRNLTLVNYKDVIKFIMKSLSNCCELDLILTEILKDTVVEISPLLTALINYSSENAVFPHKLKEAFLRPLLKMINLYPIKRYYRPISNLAFVGKLIKCITSKQIISHKDKCKLMVKVQSAYQESQSTETTLMKVKSDILTAIDNQEVTCLVLLDLLATFDLVDHWICLN